VLLETAGEGARGGAGGEGGVAPAQARARDRREAEAESLALHLARVLSGEAGVVVPEGRSPRPGEVAVLFRRLTQVAVFERAFRKAGVPIRLARGGGFHQAPEVRDLGELLASVADPADAIAWAALLRSPLCGLSDGSLLLAARMGWNRLWRDGPEEEEARARLLDALPVEEAERLRRFLTTWRGLREARDRLDVRELLERASAELDLEAALLASPDGERRAANLRKALEGARRAASRGLTAGLLAARMRRLAALPPREPEADPATGDAVVLLSVHQAKGLEWPVVAVPELSARVRGDGRRALLDGAGRVCVAHL
jgi:superfamily I DNA/RNA helicase